MHAEIVERAIAVDGLVALLERRFGVGQKILVHLDADMVDGADRVLVEQLADVPDHRVLDVVVAEDRGLAGGAGGGQHLLGIGEAGRHRLLAPDMLAGRERGSRHFEMEPVRRGDRDHVDLRVGDDLAPVAGGPCEAELRRLALASSSPASPRWTSLDIRHVAEHRLHRVPGQRMGLAHEAAADEADADRLHVTPPRREWEARSRASV